MGKRSKNSEGVETLEVTTDNTSTGAVEFPAEPKTLEASHIGADPVVTRSPSGPVTLSISWAETKVVTPDSAGTETK